MGLKNPGSGGKSTARRRAFVRQTANQSKDQEEPNHVTNVHKTETHLSLYGRRMRGDDDDDDDFNGANSIIGFSNSISN